MNSDTDANVLIDSGKARWTPRPGGTIKLSNGRQYLVDDNGGTLLRKVSGLEDAAERVREELRRLRAPCRKMRVEHNFDTEGYDVRLSPRSPGVDSGRLLAALRRLPSGCGQEKVLAEAKKIR